jgi:hypothetical protein
METYSKPIHLILSFLYLSIYMYQSCTSFISHLFPKNSEYRNDKLRCLFILFIEIEIDFSEKNIKNKILKETDDTLEQFDDKIYLSNRILFNNKNVILLETLIPSKNKSNSLFRQ